MRVDKIIAISIACVVVGTIVSLGVYVTLETQRVQENSRIYDEMSRECHEKYYDDTKGHYQQEKEYNDCIDRISEFMI